MLKNTFVHIRGVNTKAERQLWRKGVLTWEDYGRCVQTQLSLFDDAAPDERLAASMKALAAGNVAYFKERLHPHEYYRIAAYFPDDVLFLDIETTGLSSYYHKITLVGWSLGRHYGVLIAGGDTTQLFEATSRAKVLVTFNGTLFDVKFIKKFYPTLKLPPCHIDLRFFARRVGLTGGQKNIEKVLGFSRKEEAKDIQGDAAPILWYKYQHGDNDALKKLIKYNHDDIEGMKHILDVCMATYCQEKKIPSKIRPSASLFVDRKSTLTIADAQNQVSDAVVIPEYAGSAGPEVTYEQLSHILDLDSFCVAGIDLVASEERESGFCILTGCHAETARCKTDAEMIERICAANVRLVSIDSPLCLPVGRTTYWDDDPMRQQYGITRYCERELKRRGISSYPCLIPSMQKLTRRGMELATKLRKLGVPVIESYPGAAQDIMGIPKKQAGQQYLAEGLRHFGIQGDFLATPVSHDELDAITSALVGFFFWTGKFEALGTKDEEPLIIPDLHADNGVWLRRRVIGLSGVIGSGKTTVANFLASYGYVDTRFSAILRERLLAAGEVPNRSRLQELGLAVYTSGKQRALGNEVVQRIRNEERSVVDGLRFPEDRASLAEAFGPAFRHVHLECDQMLLELRQRERDEDIPLETALAHTVESGIASLAGLAHARVLNEGTQADLFNSIKCLIEDKSCR